MNQDELLIDPPMSALDQYRLAMRQRGLVPPNNIETDGELHRCEAESTYGRSDGSYLLHFDAVPAGGFVNHRDGLGWENWRADIDRNRPEGVTDFDDLYQAQGLGAVSRCIEDAQEASNVSGGKVVVGSAREPLATAEASALTQLRGAEAATEFLRGLLVIPMSVKTVKAVAAAAGHSWAAVRHAEAAIGAVRTRCLTIGGVDYAWYVSPRSR